ncbi:hypothetical protein J6590_031924 [Homalodisca vitripennis]|nr:hypothetical protein J6590_031924 [Homalodisca vitripennis]
MFRPEDLHDSRDVGRVNLGPKFQKDQEYCNNDSKGSDEYSSSTAVFKSCDTPTLCNPGALTLSLTHSLFLPLSSLSSYLPLSVSLSSSSLSHSLSLSLPSLPIPLSPCLYVSLSLSLSISLSLSLPPSLSLPSLPISLSLRVSLSSSLSSSLFFCLSVSPPPLCLSIYLSPALNSFRLL